MQDIDSLFETARQLFHKKNAAYGRDNISRVGAAGVASRLEDKLGRIKTLLESGRPVGDETLLDTSLDIANYGIIMASLVQGTWGEADAHEHDLQVVGENLHAPKLAGDVGYDLATSEGATLKPGEITYLKTNVFIKCPVGYWVRISGRSSTLRKRRVQVFEGIIDNGYTGHLEIACMPLCHELVDIQPGERLAQLVFYPVVAPRLVRVDKLPETNRGSNGFGSTGQ